MSLSAEQRRIRASIAANDRWSREDAHPAMAKVREGFDRKWEDQVDPARTLSDIERRRRAKAAMRAHMQRMALRSSRKRAERKSADR
jgi:hypothetical protein